MRPAGTLSANAVAELANAVAAFAPKPGAAAIARPATIVTEAALLDAIRAAPFDDAPREVYADWLTERADPRGEFIALQLELARRALSADEAKRERALLRKHAKQWGGEFARALPAFGMLVSAEPPAELQTLNTTYFTRGFLSRITLNGFTDALTRKLADHPAFATIEDITCGSKSGVRFASLFERSALQALRRVHVPVDLALALAAGPHAARIVELTTRRLDNDVAPVLDALVRFPRLARFRLIALGPNADDERLADTARKRLGGRVAIEIVDYATSA